MVKEIKILLCEKTVGKGTDEDPYRIVYEFYTHDGDEILKLSQLEEWHEKDSLVNVNSLRNIIKEIKRV